ncbi:MAG: VWA domain-containing protein, partial [Anaerolineae bacterium]|nr:VWA domain-containing protein [Anaerolineae bacterium]
MTFTAPLALLLLIALPITWWIGRPRAVYRRGRDLASLALRTLLLLCLILALAGAQIVRPADKLAVVFLVDASDSMGGEALTEQFSTIEAALAGMRPDDEAGVIVFGGDALVERPMSRVRELAPFRSAPNRANTDLEEAISLGLALFPSDAARRMVILSDGRATVGDAEVAAQRAAAVGVEISTVSFSRPPQPEVQVTDVRVPAAVGAGQQFDIAIGVDSEEATPALLTVFASGAILYSEPVTLRAGQNNYTLTLTAGDSGFRDFRVQVDPAGSDGYFQNNQLSAFSRV